MDPSFHRPALAKQLAERLLNPPATSPSASGLFLAAPRRTGKSTFLREDLRPTLEDANALVVYVDLWQDRKADPGEVIVNGIRQALAARSGALKRLMQSSGLENVRIAGVSFDLGNIGLNQGVSLSAALSALSDDARQVIVLIIDEAQHAITSSAGAEALFALKAARDELNSSRHHGLRIVATGSNRDKLAMLRGGKEQAFFGAPLIEFPVLGRDYIDWYLAHLPFGTELDAERVYASFVRSAHRPEILGAAVDMMLYDLNIAPGEHAERLDALIADQINDANAQLLRVVQSLTPLQSAVLRELAEQGEQYAPFEQASLARYQQTLRLLAPESDLKADAANVQQALVALQDKALVWRAARGVYALEDNFLADLMREHGLLDR